MSENEKQITIIKEILIELKGKLRNSKDSIEKLKPKNLALIHVIFPKIIKYIKSIADISLFQGL